MFNFKRVFGLAILSAAAALSGCGGGGSGSQEPLAVCTDGLVLNQATNQCEKRPPVCPAGFVFPDDLVIDETTTSADCVPIPYAGPEPVYLPAEDEAVIYYNRQHVDADYSSTNIFRWNGCAPVDIDWEGTLAGFPGPTPAVQPTGIDPVYGAYYVFNITAEAQAAVNSCGNYIISIGGNANQSADLSVTFKGEQPSPWYRTSFFIASDTGDNSTGRVSSGTPICLEPAADSSDVCRVPEPPARALKDFAAHWLDGSTIAYNVDGATDVEIYVSPSGGFEQNSEGAIEQVNGTYLLGTLEASAFTDAQREAAPYVTGDGWFAYSFSGENVPSTEQIKDALRGHLLFTLNDDSVLKGTFVQTHEVLDALYTAAAGSDTPLAESADLGVVYGDAGITVSVWAPTAQTMALKSYSAGFPKFVLDTLPMTFDSATGIWSLQLPASANGTFYRYQLSMIDQTDGSLKLLQTTDPYSVSLSVDGLYSQIVDLSDSALKPDGWDGHEVPTIASQAHAKIYEGHIRDFSARDVSTSEANRGKYLAFTEESVPVQHLRELAESGLTHFHMLPAFDFASVVEAEDFQANLEDPLEGVCAFSPLIQACLDFNPTQTVQSVVEALTASDPLNADAEELLRAVAQIDAFNWGYDPHHFNAPEGSYASDPEGPVRILEFRAMVKALHEMGLRVVMDVVYNHTNASGLSAPKSNFDKLVPGYYFRRGVISGGIEGATCCEDTASENAMMGKFVEDSLVQWADQYKIDAFRFDLMAYHPKELIESSLLSVQSVDPDTFFYGEGWTVANDSSADARFTQSNQPNMAGTGVGTFNDNMRDPLHDLVLFEAGEAANDGNPATAAAIGGIDAIRVGMAGNLASFPFYNSASVEVTGSSAGGYGAAPQENVAHVSVHDNWTLWDYMHLEGNYTEVTSGWDSAERARAQMATLSIPMFSQGISFFHMGTDILRSKSMDRNSFNSGDWFNYVDFTQTSNNWAVAKPWDVGDEGNRPTVAVAFDDLESLPLASTIALSSDVFNEYLKIASSSPLFSLQTADDVNARVGFHNQGRSQNPGLIVMSIDDGDTPASIFADNENVSLPSDIDLEDLDPNHEAIVVIVNASTVPQTHEIATASSFELHPVQVASADEVVRTSTFSEADGVGSFTVPGLTTAVFIKMQGASQGYGLYAGASPAPGGFVPNPFGEDAPAIFVRGLDVGDWAALPERELSYNGDGTFTALFDVTGSVDAYGFKIAAASYEDIELGGSGGNRNTVVELSQRTVLDGTDDLEISIPPLEDDNTDPDDSYYRFDLQASTNPPALTVTKTARVYVRGGFGDWGTTDEAVWVAKDVFEAEIEVEDAINYQFKIADYDWGGTAGIDFGGVSGSADGETTVTLGEPVTLTKGGPNLGMDFTSLGAGAYVFNVDFSSNPDSPVLTVTAPNPLAAPIYLRGGVSDWGASVDNEMEYQGDFTFTFDAPIQSPGAYQFKVADADWGGGATNYNYGGEGDDGSTVVELGGTALPMENGGSNLGITTTSTGALVRFTADFSGGTEAPTIRAEEVSP